MFKFSLTMRQRAALAAFAVLACCALEIPAWASVQKVTVKIDNFTFNPNEIKIAAGTEVTFINQDDIPHTVVDSALTFRSKALDTGDTFSFSFAKAGEYQFFCSLHPMMMGKIIVEPEHGF